MRQSLTSGVVVAATLTFALSACGSEVEKNAQPESAQAQTPPTTTAARKPLYLYVKAPDSVRSNRVKLLGRATPGSVIRVSGKKTKVKGDGTWLLAVDAKRGENTYEVTASQDGHEPADDVVFVTRNRSKAEVARAAAARKSRAVAREAAFKSSAQTVPYNQLKKNPDRYAGDRVKFTGQIFQIQEDGDSGGMMLIAVTDEGYGYWTDNVWVNYSRSIKSAEDDVVTVYGEIDGSRSYDTQIGGETYVPEMTAKYIEE